MLKTASSNNTSTLPVPPRWPINPIHWPLRDMRIVAPVYHHVDDNHLVFGEARDLLDAWRLTNRGGRDGTLAEGLALDLALAEQIDPVTALVIPNGLRKTEGGWAFTTNGTAWQRLLWPTYIERNAHDLLALTFLIKGRVEEPVVNHKFQMYSDYFIVITTDKPQGTAKDTRQVIRRQNLIDIIARERVSFDPAVWADRIAAAQRGMVKR